MNRKMKMFLSVLLSVCLLSALALPALAAGDGDDPNVYINKGVYKNGDYKDSDSVYTFDPASGTLTIDDRGNAVPVNDEYAFCDWIKSIAAGVKTVQITKKSELENFSIRELTEEELAEYEEGYQEVYPNNVFWIAFSYLNNLERFTVEKGNKAFEAKDGVLYTRHCYKLVHYPAAKPDKTYTVDDWCLMDIYPFAFCNTRFLECVELPYARDGSYNYMVIGDYAFSAFDVETGRLKESSIKQIAFYGTTEEFYRMLDYTEGNEAAETAQIIEKPTSKINDLIAYIKRNLFIHVFNMFDLLRYITN